jgi:hypothetical protein
MNRVLTIFSFVATFANQLVQVQLIGGQFDVTMNSFTQTSLTDKSVIDISNLVIRKFNRTHQAVKGNATVLRDFDNDMKVNMINVSKL